MPVVGIIAEYNPLHSGHAYHIQKARDLTEAEACVCILSSNFVQRGEPSIVSKFARANMALSAGTDLVIELPSPLSCASAEYFASGGIKLLESLGIVDYVCFGSEEGNLEKLDRTAELLAFESAEFKDELRRGLDQGLSFASARQQAVEVILSKTGCSQEQQTGRVIEKPNNILGIEYIKALKKLGSSIQPVTVERKGQGYSSTEEASSFSSATAIRQHIYSKEVETSLQSVLSGSNQFLSNNMPESSIKLLNEEFLSGRGPVNLKSFESIILYLLRSLSVNELASLPYIEEGLENRLKYAALASVTLDQLISSVVTSRYPASRIRRILCALLIGLKAELLDELKANGYAPYLRVLGFNETGRKLLSRIRKSASLPIITKPAYYKKQLDSLGQRLFEIETAATDVYCLGYPNQAARAGRIELKSSPVYIKS